jgi:hypothetical protein
MSGSTVLNPRVLCEPRARDLLWWCVNELEGCNSAQEVTALRPVLYERIEACEAEADVLLHLRICVSLFCDLRAQQWRLRLHGDQIEATPPNRNHLDPAEQKQHVRAGHLLERDAQLADPATRRFISSLERRQPHGSGWQRSIFSLMRDGRDLAAKLTVAREMPVGPDRMCALRAAVDPYVQVVERGVSCEHTGLDLYDIWRYFRHTWSTAYRSVPGRQISFLIRDRSAPCHPVIGIGALTSAVVQQQNRDLWIGWHPKRFFTLMAETGSQQWAQWLRIVYAGLLSEIYTNDFVSEGLVSEIEIEDPSEAVIARLRDVAATARRAHRLYPDLRQHKAARPGREAVDWVAQAQTQLFRSKRAAALADLLEARRQLLAAGFNPGGAEDLARIAANKLGRRAITTILRRVKASHVGVDMMEIAVCGAVAPYTEILGGKLVSMLMVSPDVIAAYQQRYSDAVSIIASSMAGRAVNRRPRLVLLSTTSLYGVASSQYNRVRIPADEVGGTPGLQLRYKDLEKTSGYGLYHISMQTVEAMEVLLARAQLGREVNSIFGEGVNPKLRKVRAALEAVGLPSDLLLQHSSPRIVYVVPVATNFREVLLGCAEEPDYILPQTSATTTAIADYWRRRWLDNRIEDDAVLDRVKEHTLVYPVVHGARVPLLVTPEEQLGVLLEQ